MPFNNIPSRKRRLTQINIVENSSPQLCGLDMLEDDLVEDDLVEDLFVNETQREQDILGEELTVPKIVEKKEENDKLGMKKNGKKCDDIVSELREKRSFDLSDGSCPISLVQLEVLERMCGNIINDLNEVVDLDTYCYLKEIITLLAFFKKNMLMYLYNPLWSALGLNVLRNFKTVFLWKNERNFGDYRGGVRTYTFKLIEALCRRFNVCLLYGLWL